MTLYQVNGKTYGGTEFVSKSVAMDFMGLKRSAFDSLMRKHGVAKMKYGTNRQSTVLYRMQDLADVRKLYEVAA